MPSLRHAPWGAAAAVVTLGWGAGYLLWQPDPPGEFGAYFDLELPKVTLALGAPLAGVAGLLLGREGVLRSAGHAVLALTCLVLAYLASFAFFGGFCLDPGEACITTWPSRLAELGAAVACLAAGWIVHGCAGRFRNRST